MAELKEARVPDIGGYDDVPVIELLVAVGDTVKQDQGLVTLESDKATMEVPAPFAGVVRELKVKLGDKLSEGSVVAMIEAGGDAAADAKPRRRAAAAAKPRRRGRRAPTPAAETGAARRTGRASRRSPTRSRSAADRRRAAPSRDARQQARHRSPKPRRRARRRSRSTPTRVLPDKVPYASPAVRLFARELGVDLAQVQGSERGGRISKEDVQQFVKRALAGGGAAGGGAAPAGGGLNLLPWPKVDFAKFGEIETKPLSRIQKISGANLARNWAMIPHVTQHDDADITELEALRVALNKENEKAGRQADACSPS